RRVAVQTDRNRFFAFFQYCFGLVDGSSLRVEVARLQAHLDAARVAFDSDHRSARYRGRERLRAAHAAEPGGEDPFSRPASAVVLAARFREGLVGALHDALAADVDPRARSHLA